MELKEELGDAFDKIKKEASALAGKEAKDKEYKSEKDYKTKEKAIDMLHIAKAKLLDVNKWSDIPFPGLATFAIYNREGKSLKKSGIEVNDYIKIVLPGPVPPNWVVVVDVQDREDSAWFTVRPSENPLGNREKTEHFFTSEATSTFKVERSGTKVLAYEIGKHEVINNRGKEAGDRKVINTVVAEGGWLGYQAIQWNKLTDYLVGNLD
ncbi:MAG TPA: hypothetical protein VIK89_08200 [Cytophagaceae bacterium]